MQVTWNCFWASLFQKRGSDVYQIPLVSLVILVGIAYIWTREMDQARKILITVVAVTGVIAYFSVANYYNILLFPEKSQCIARQDK